MYENGTMKTVESILRMRGDMITKENDGGGDTFKKIFFKKKNQKSLATQTRQMTGSPGTGNVLNRKL
jgi:hypothetical protein